jgi:phosphoribosylformimino-5-aminoimidazole carboxamide ribotide isomerase
VIEVYAAVDILGGRCVRLRRGETSEATDYGDPVEMAERWESEGCDWLHVVDLDGATAGRPVNVAKVAAIIATVSVPVQLGGGLRDPDSVEAALGAGCERVVLGSAALEDPELVLETVRRWPGRVAVALDVRGGEVAIKGWKEGSGLDLVAAVRKLTGASLPAVVVTDIGRDGMMSGIDVGFIESVLEVTEWPVIVSGGVSSIGDAQAIAALAEKHRKGHKLCGVIVGRALYEGAVAISELKSVLAG